MGVDRSGRAVWCGRLLGAGVSTCLWAVHTMAFAQSAPAPSLQPPRRPPEPQVQNKVTSPSFPPGWGRFQIRQDTPAERDAFLQKRAAIMAAHPVHDVPPLPEQAITPSSRQ